MSIDAYDLPGDFVKPEGITMGPDRDFFSGSRTDGAIYRCSLDEPTAKIWSPGGIDERTIVLGFALYADVQLIVCGAETGTLYSYDLASRELVSKRSIEGYLNDVWVIGDHAYATDSSQPVVWRFDLLNTELAPEPIHLKDTGPKVYPNGIVALNDEVLLVADPGEEVLLRVELDGSTQVLATEWAADGLLLLDDLLIGVCNRGDVLETAEFFLSALRLTPDGTAATPLGRYDDPRFDTPTTVAFDGERLLVVNGQSGQGRRRRSPLPGHRPPPPLAALTVPPAQALLPSPAHLPPAPPPLHLVDHSPCHPGRTLFFRPLPSYKRDTGRKNSVRRDSLGFQTSARRRCFVVRVTGFTLCRWSRSRFPGWG